MAKQNPKAQPLPVPDLDDISEEVFEGDEEVTEASRPKISIADIREALAHATEEDKAHFAEAIGLSKVIGAPKLRQKRVTDEEVKNIALATGGASHPEGWTPTPPEYVTDRGEQAVFAWKQQWLDGQVKNWDTASDTQIAEMVASAKM